MMQRDRRQSNPPVAATHQQLTRTVSPHSCDQCASNRFRNDACR